VPESTPTEFCIFLSDPESKIYEKPDPDSEPFFKFGLRLLLLPKFEKMTFKVIFSKFRQQQESAWLFLK